MHKFFGGLIVLIGFFFAFVAAVVAYDGQYVGASITGVIAFAIIAYGGHLQQKGGQAVLSAKMEEIDDGLHAVLAGPHDLVVRAAPQFYEDHEEKPGQKPTAESRRELKRLNVRCDEIVTEADALAVRMALWNVPIPCHHCGEDADYEEVKCDYCGKRLWQQTLQVHLEKITAASP